MGVSTATVKIISLFIGFICLAKFQRPKNLLFADVSGRQMIFVLHLRFLDTLFVVTFGGGSFSHFRILLFSFVSHLN